MTQSAEGNKFSSFLKGPLNQFLELKRSIGYKYRHEERILFALDELLNSVPGGGVPTISCDIVRQYVARRGKESDTTRLHRLTVLRQFCLFLALDDPHTFVPPRMFMGIKRCAFTPRILTRNECRRFVEACLALPNAHCSPLRGAVLGTALLVLFLTGLRAGEALRLTVRDVNLDSATLHVRKTKFGKSRYVPLADDLVDQLRSCKETVFRRLGDRLPHDPFFCTSRGKAYSISALWTSFRQTLARSEIAWMGKGEGPRMHDLRHNAAVLRMLLWYETGMDLEAKLPLLATYLGHKDLMGTQRYLHLTQELLAPITSRYQARFGYLIDSGGSS